MIEAQNVIKKGLHERVSRRKPLLYSSWKVSTSPQNLASEDCQRASKQAGSILTSLVKRTPLQLLSMEVDQSCCGVVLQPVVQGTFHG